MNPETGEKIEKGRYEKRRRSLSEKILFGAASSREKKDA